MGLERMAGLVQIAQFWQLIWLNGARAISQDPFHWQHDPKGTGKEKEVLLADQSAYRFTQRQPLEIQ
jgi:hypothetical protein